MENHLVSDKICNIVIYNVRIPPPKECAEHYKYCVDLR